MFKLIAASLCVALLVGCSSNPYTSLDRRPLISSWTDGSDAGVPRAKLYAESVLPYAIMSYDVYNDDPSEFEQFPYPKNENWTEILHGQGIEDDIGFAAKAWVRTKESQEKEVVIVYRGTDGIFADFFRGNLVFFKPYIYRTHFDAAEEFSDKVRKAVSDQNISSFVYTGHSLGGGLAEYVHKLNDGSKAVTFDSSFNTGFIYSLFSDTSNQNMIRAYEKGEFLEWPRKLLLPDTEWDETPWENEINTIWFQFYSSNLGAAHDMQDLAMSIVKAAVLNGSESAKSVMQQVMDKTAAR